MTAKRAEDLQSHARQLQPVPGPTASRVWAVGGGKGGIGKSFLAANIAAAAARAGRRVILIDADLGGANLHTCIGVRASARVTLADYLDNRLGDLAQAAIDTPIPRLRLIVGALGQVGAAETTVAQRQELIRAIRELSADVVIVDLAAGVDRATLDLFLVSDGGFVVTTPEPTAIENAYAFIRGALFRRLSGVMTSSPLRDSLREAMERRSERGIRTPRDLLEEIDRIDLQEGERFRQALEECRPRLVLNQVRSPDEIKLGFSIRSVCRKQFGIDLDYVGYVNFDDSVWRSVKERRPLVVTHPHSDGALYIRRIVKKILED